MKWGVFLSFQKLLFGLVGDFGSCEKQNQLILEKSENIGHLRCLKTLNNARYNSTFNFLLNFTKN